MSAEQRVLDQSESSCMTGKNTINTQFNFEGNNSHMSEPRFQKEGGQYDNDQKNEDRYTYDEKQNNNILDDSHQSQRELKTIQPPQTSISFQN